MNWLKMLDQHFLLILLAICRMAIGDKTPALLLPDCAKRCESIYGRSLGRIHYSRKTIENLGTIGFRKLDHTGQRNICWKSFDFMDCMNHCESAVKDHGYRTLSKHLRLMCRTVVSADEMNFFACISKYHSFMEFRCSSFMNEALMRNEQMEDFKQRKIDSCRYLHYHSICLGNSLHDHCPDAGHLFNRFTLRDYFLSFVLPQNEAIFDETMLDDCRVIIQSMHLLFEPLNVTSSQDTVTITHVTMPDRQIDHNNSITTLTTKPMAIIAMQSPNKSSIDEIIVTKPTPTVSVPLPKRTIQPTASLKTTTLRPTTTASTIRPMKSSTRSPVAVTKRPPTSHSTTKTTAVPLPKRTIQPTASLKTTTPRTTTTASTIRPMKSSTRLPVTVTKRPPTSHFTTKTTAKHRLFSPQIDFISDPPNFYYSSMRYSIRPPSSDHQTTSIDHPSIVTIAPSTKTTTASPRFFVFGAAAKKNNGESPPGQSEMKVESQSVTNGTGTIGQLEDYGDDDLDHIVTPGIIDLTDTLTNEEASHVPLTTSKVTRDLTTTTMPTTKVTGSLPTRHYTGRIFIRPIRNQSDSISEDDRFWNSARYRKVKADNGGANRKLNRQRYHVSGGTTEMPLLFTDDGLEYYDDPQPTSQPDPINPTVQAGTIERNQMNKIWPLGDVKTIEQLNKLSQETEHSVLLVVFALLGGTVLASTIGICLALLRRTRHRKADYNVQRSQCQSSRT